MKIKRSEIYDLWRNEKPITIYGSEYHVGKMSYGDYFFEPLEKYNHRTERDGFANGTIWPQVTND